MRKESRRLKPEFRQPSIGRILSRKVIEARRNLIERIEDLSDGQSLLIMSSLKRHSKQTTRGHLKKGYPLVTDVPHTETEAVEWQERGVPFLEGKPKVAIPMRLRAEAVRRYKRRGISPWDLAHIVFSEPRWGRNRYSRVTTPNEILEGQRIFAANHQAGSDIRAYIYCDPGMAPKAETEGGKAIVHIPSRYIGGDDVKLERRHLPVVDNEFKLAVALLYEATKQRRGFEFNFLGFGGREDPRSPDWMVIDRYDAAGELAIIKQAKEDGIVNSDGHPLPLEMTPFPICTQPQIDFYKRCLDSVAIWDSESSKPRKPQYGEIVRLLFARMFLRGYYATSFVPASAGKVEDQKWDLRWN